jgi:hypothetical protein
MQRSDLKPRVLLVDDQTQEFPGPGHAAHRRLRYLHSCRETGGG